MKYTPYKNLTSFSDTEDQQSVPFQFILRTNVALMKYVILIKKLRKAHLSNFKLSKWYMGGPMKLHELFQLRNFKQKRLRACANFLQETLNYK